MAHASQQFMRYATAGITSCARRFFRYGPTFILICILCLSIASSDLFARATSPSWRDCVLSAYTTERNGKIAEARAIWLKAFAIAQKLGPSHPWYTVSLRNLGRLYMIDCTDFDKPKSYFQRELSILKTLGDNYPDLIYDYYYLARIYSIKGQFEQARQNLERAVVISQDQSTDSDTLIHLFSYIQVPYHALGLQNQEREYQRKLMAHLLHKYPANEVAQEICPLARTVKQDGDSAGESIAARAFYQVSLHLCAEALQYPQPANHRALLLRLSADTYLRLHEYDAALAKASQGLSALSPNSTDRENFGLLCAYAGQALETLDRPDEAQGYYCNALKFPDLPQYVRDTLVESLVRNYVSAQQYEKALQLTAGNAASKHRPYVLISIARAYALKGNEPSAANYLRKALAIYKSRPVTEDQVAGIIHMSHLFRRLGAVSEADQCIATGLARAKQKFGPDSLDMADALVQAAGEREAQYEPANAAEQQRLALSILQKRAEIPVNALAQALVTMAGICLWQNEPALATGFANRALKLEAEHRAPFDWHRSVQSTQILGLSACYEGDFRKAEDLFKKRLDILADNGSKRDRDLGLVDLACAYSLRDKYAESERIYRSIIEAKDDMPEARYWFVHDLLEQRRNVEAEKLCNQSLEAMTKGRYINPWRRWRGVFLGFRGRLLSLHGQHDQAQSAFVQANEILHQEGDIGHVADLLYFQAQDFLANNQQEKAEAAMQESLSLYGQMRPYVVDYRKQCSQSRKDLPKKP